jgi:hypothetical protein
VYFSLGGYSQIAQVVPLIPEKPLIDIFIYGALHPEYKYRHNFISQLKQRVGPLKMLVSDNLWGPNLDEKLKVTRIVVHIPSHPNCEHMPWAKLNYLQSRKVFFIVEENSELTKLNMTSIIPTFKRNDVVDLISKIKLYLNNSHLMEHYVEQNYEYIKKHNNLDVVIPRIMDNIM